MTLSVQVVKEDSTCTFKLSGILDISTIDLFNKHYLDLEHHTALILDFSNLEFTDSTGIGAILDVMYVSKDKGITVKFEGLNDSIKEIFDTIGVMRVLEALRREES